MFIHLFAAFRAVWPHHLITFSTWLKGFILFKDCLSRTVKVDKGQQLINRWWGGGVIVCQRIKKAATILRLCALSWVKRLRALRYFDTENCQIKLQVT